MTTAPVTAADEASTWRTRLPWILIPLAGAVWGAILIRPMWYYLDEWGWVDRAVNQSRWSAMSGSFVGHLWFFQDPVYRAQVDWLGVNDHTLIEVVMVVGLVGLHVCVARVLRSAGLGSTLALLLAALATYLGAGAQNVVFPVQWCPATCLALSLTVMVIVLTRPPSTGRLALVVGLLLLAFTFDSGLAIIGLAFVVPALVRCWPRRHLLVLVPALVAQVLWLTLSSPGVRDGGTIGQRIRFSIDLLFWAFGGLVGHPGRPGIVVAAVLVATVVFGGRRGYLSSRSITVLWCGVTAAIVGIGTIAQVRAGIVRTEYRDSNRFIYDIALALVVGFGPCVHDTWKGVVTARVADGRGRRSLLELAPAIAIGLAAIGGFGELRAYRGALIDGGRINEQTVAGAALLVRDGCPSGEAPADDAVLDPILLPNVTVGLVRELVERGSYEIPDGVTPSDDLVGRFCPVG